MKFPILLILCLIVTSSAIAQKEYVYPSAPKDTTTNTYFNVLVEDPYQWMENPDDPRLESWLEAQKHFTKKLSNQQTRSWELRQQIAAMYYGTKRDTSSFNALRDKSRLSKYVFERKWTRYDRSPDIIYKLRGKENYRTLLRAKDFQLNKDENVLVTDYIVNEDEDLVVAILMHNGSDWRTGYVFDLKSGKQLSDTLKYMRGDNLIEWYKKKIIYARFNPPAPGRELLDKATGQKIYLHSLGDHQTKDRLLIANPDQSGTNSISFTVFDDDLILYHFYQVQDKYYKAISKASLATENFVLKNFLVYPNSNDIGLSVEAIGGDSVFLKTNWNAPNERVLLVDVNQPNQIHEFVPEYDITLREVNGLGKGKITCIYNSHDHDIALIFNLKGELLRKIDFPNGKTVQHFYENNTEAAYTNFSVSSFYHPPLWYQLSLDNLTFKPIESVSVPYDPESLETRQVYFPSNDGTEIPMYITCKKDVKLNGNNPVLIYGYGGYGITVEPNFDESVGLWLLHGGILAVPNIRGGGAKGTRWGQEGRRLKKQNGIDDFIAAAKYLLTENYTNPDKIAINGGSHGGMIVAAAITQRPDLFKAAIAEAGPYDMIRKELYVGASTSLNLLEYGSTKNEEDFRNLYSYSPLHQVKPSIQYPNLLLITGDSDDRVPPLHTYKFLANLQEQGDPKGLYHAYITPGSGHHGALTIDDWIDYLMYKSYFLFDQLDIDFY